MALEIEDGTAKSNAEAYISVTDADAFLGSEPRGEDWLSLDSGDKEKWLRQAARVLDLECDWIGTIKTDTQALAWPRINARREDPVSFETVTGYANLQSGSFYEETTIPTNIKRANAVLARYLSQSDRYADAEQAGRTSGVSTAKGSRSYGRPDGVSGRVIPLEVHALVRRLCDTVTRPLRRVA